MKKRFTYYIISWALIVGLYNLIVFIVPVEKFGFTRAWDTFFAVYIPVMISFIGQLVCAYIGLNQDSLKKTFYNIPVVTVSYIGTIGILIVGSICMLFPDFPAWVAIIFCVIILAATIISVLTVKANADIVEEIDDKVKRSTKNIKSLITSAEIIKTYAKDEEISKEINKVYEAIRYSDPMSNEATEELEEKIAMFLDELKTATKEGNVEQVKDIAGNVVDMVNERNIVCKGNK